MCIVGHVKIVFSWNS